MTLIPTIPIAIVPAYNRGLTTLRRVVRISEAGLVLLAVPIGILAGLLTMMQGRLAHGLQLLLNELGTEGIAADAIFPVRLLAIPVAGLALGIGSAAAIRRWRTPVDVVEANALRGGVIPMRDTLIVCAQTIVSNGAGASVGLEAAYAQAAGGTASGIGQWLRLRRADMRILVGAGAGAAIGAAFNAPLAGAFYAFEIVIGAYTSAAIAPVVAACLSAVLVARLFGTESRFAPLSDGHAIATVDYLLFGFLGILCAVIGIAIMRSVSFVEKQVRNSPIKEVWRPAVGGMLIIPFGMITPQLLSAGHGALHLDLATEVTWGFIFFVLVAKIAASAISLGFGFRGGLFFASLFIGTLVGKLFADASHYVAAFPSVSASNASLVGMAAMAVAVVGGPMTMSMLVLEMTHDFALTGVSLAAALCASTFVRETFGFSFSTWRLHMRGETIRSARDIGRVRDLTAGKMMQRGAETAPLTMSVAEFRQRFPLGSPSNVILTNGTRRYFGLIETARAFDPMSHPDVDVSSLASWHDVTLQPSDDVHTIISMFDKSGADHLAVIDDDQRVLGILSERFVHRRYADELEKTQQEAFGE